MVSQESSHLYFLILSQEEAIIPTMELSTKVIYLKSNITKWQSQNLNSDLYDLFYHPMQCPTF